jgi:AbrB family looped-hinge helix DNA binding protein
MEQASAHVAENGRLVIPAAIRRALGLESGGDVILRLEKDELRILTKRQQLARAKAMIRRHIPEGRSLVDELIRERREAAKRE